MSEVKSDTPRTDALYNAGLCAGMTVEFFDMLDLSRELECDLTEARKNAARYEKVRIMNVSQFGDVWFKNISTGIPFDQLVDEWEAGK
jgi:hypothetical protein